MEPILFLVHRIPFPPTKGDKVVSHHLLKFLATRYRVHLGTFVDDPRDMAFVPRLGDFCTSSKVVPISKFARLRSLSGLLSGEALSVRYYRDERMLTWVRDTVREHRIERALVFSSAMAQFVQGIPGLRVVVDFVDVDSDKWDQYAKSRWWPLSLVFRREAARLLAFEQAIATTADASVFVTAGEAALFKRLAPESGGRVHHVQIGVDAEAFSPSQDFTNPFSETEDAIVFTGTMNYWPNVDAVCWFAQQVLPMIAAKRPRVRFHIVGMHPASAVMALARQARVVVTGPVPDVRPYLRHARVVVAPLRVARGIQTKVLEAMAMARPVVVSSCAAEALSGLPGVDYEVACDAPEFARKTIALLNRDNGYATGAAARARVIADYDWSKNLEPFDALLRPRTAASPGQDIGVAALASLA